MYVSNRVAIRGSSPRGISQRMKLFIQERNHTHVTIQAATNPMDANQGSKSINAPTPARNHSPAVNVARNLPKKEITQFTCELILEKDHITVLFLIVINSSLQKDI